MTNPQVGPQMEARRTALRLTMRAAARLGGVSVTGWSDVESGRRAASPTVQRAVAQALGWPVDWLDYIEAGIDPPVVSQRDDEVAQLRSLVADLGEQQAEMAARLAELGAEVALLRGRSRRAAAG